MAFMTTWWNFSSAPMPAIRAWLCSAALASRLTASSWSFTARVAEAMKISRVPRKSYERGNGVESP
jgi:hypothetical protein